MALTVLDVIRPVMGVGSLIAPRATGRAAFEMFCKPPRARPPAARHAALVSKVERRLDDAERRLVAYEGGTVAVYAYPPLGNWAEAEGRGTVLLLHGWASKAAFMTSFVAPLRAEGFRVVLVDLPGHGLSSGRLLHVPLAIRALAAVHAAAGPWHGIISHSFGGAVSTTMLAGGVKGLPAIGAKRLVLIGTPQCMPTLFRNFGSMVGLRPRAQSALEARVHELAGHPLTTFKGAEQLARVGTPTLVLHAPDDKEVPFADAEALAKAGPFVTLQPVPGAGHRRILHASQAIAAAVAHIAG
jgi:pimeloyl-ACP methyl ester carboxylesterase